MLMLGAQSDKMLLTGLCFFFSIALFAAVQAPATGYELDIYAATPITVWIPILLMGGIGVVTVFWADGTTRAIGALSLPAIPVIIITLPLLRSYHYLGNGDSQTYLGLSRHIVESGTVKGIIYPAIPVLAATTSEVTTIPLEQVWLVILTTVAAMFITGIVLAVRAIDPHRTSVVMGAISAAFFLPLNQMPRAGVFTPPSTTTMAIFLTSVLLYFLIQLFDRSHWRWTVATAVFSLGILFVHPQQAVNALLVCAAMGIYAVRRSPHSLREAVYRTGYWPVAGITGVAFWLWVANSEVFVSTISAISIRFSNPDTSSTGSEVSSDVSGAESSLAAVGGSIPELLVKVFLLSVIACAVVAIAAAIFMISIRDQSSVPETIRPIGKMSSKEWALVLGIVPVIGITLVYFVAITQYFRHIAFAMVVISIVFPLSLARFVQKTPIPYRRVSRGASIFLLTLALILTGMTMHFSPWIFQDSSHVPKSQVNGYEHTFEYIEENPEVAHLRSNPSRYYDYIYGTPTSPTRKFDSYTLQVLYSLREKIDTSSRDRYYVVTTSDRQQEFVLYNETFLTKDDVMYLDYQTNRVYHNGEFELYRQTFTDD